MAANGFVIYLDPSVESSLHRNGRVLTRRDPNGSDAGTEGVIRVQEEVTVHDARAVPRAERPTLRRNGFELLHSPLPNPELDFLAHETVLREYYPECERLLLESTGAAGVFAFDHNVRSPAGKDSEQRIRGGQKVQGPARMAHGDYTLTSAPQRLHELTLPPSGNDTLRSLLPPDHALLDAKIVAECERCAIINVWRNIDTRPVASHPLALCDAQTVLPEDLVVFEIHYADRVGENYFAKPSPRHRWCFYPEMAREEALLIKQWDSAGEFATSEGARPDSAAPDEPCTFSFHTAFTERDTPPDAPPRWSVEVRCVVLYE